MMADQRDHNFAQFGEAYFTVKTAFFETNGIFLSKVAKSYASFEERAWLLNILALTYLLFFDPSNFCYPTFPIEVP